MKIFILALFVATAAADKIVGGIDATRGEAPYIINMKSSGSFRCGGSIISDMFVVSAGHCQSSSTSTLTITAGDHVLTQDELSEQTIQVAEQIRHRRYSSRTLENDIMLLRLETPLQFNNYVAKAILPSANVDPAVGEVCTVLGWGTLSEGGYLANTLQKVDVPVVSNADCNVSYGGDITSGMICLGVPEGGKDACQGDSGGPFVCGGYLHGITSWGIGCAREGYPGVYTRVSHYIDWMAENM